jgi:hypothetical protein
MTTTYTPAKSDVTDVLETVMGRYHGDIADNGITIGILMATSDEEGEPAVKLHGYPCAATIQITSYKNRCLGIADAVITIEADIWKTFTEAEKIAVLDHELTHLELVYDKDGVLKTDDANRPKLKMRLHDWQLGGFAVIAERHGAASIESQEFRAAYHTYYQQLFKWSDDQGGENDEIMESSTVSITGAQIGKLTAVKKQSGA